MQVTWVGHSTLIVNIDGVNVLTDPIWSERCSPLAFAGPKRRQAPGVAFEDLPPIDVVIISHNHYDHLDLPTARHLAEKHDPLFVVPLGVAPDGFNINDKVGATAPAALIHEVVNQKADLGIALDGDGDRVLMVDGAGRSYDGDQLLYAIARHRARKKRVAGVAGTLMTNFALEKAFARLGVPFARARVGDRYVLELLREKGWDLGGENSGHIICLDKHTTGDGIVSALQALQAMRESGRGLAELTAGLVMYPQVLVNVAVPRGFDWQAHASIATAKTQAEDALDGRGRVLLRPSGTEPVLRVMVEGEPRDAIQSAADAIAAAVRRVAAG